MISKTLVDKWFIISGTSIAFALICISISAYYYGGEIEPPFGFQVLLVITVANYLTSFIAKIISDKNKSK